MNKIYDKLLLLLAFLALVAGVFLYLKKSEAASRQQSDFVVKPAQNPYQPVPVPESESKEAAWVEPDHQSSGPNWLYDVFTPPKIYLDADGNFTAEPPKVIGPPKPFGIYLAQLQRKPYRIQLQGYSGDRNKPEEAVLFLFDEERQKRFTTRPGQKNEEAQIEVLDFKIERHVYDDSNIEVTAITTILDLRSAKEIKLNDDERLYEPEITVVFRSEEDPDVEVDLLVDPADPQVEFETPAGKYLLQEINLEASTVTVEKQATEETEAQSLILSPVADTAGQREETEEETIDTPPVEESNLDFLF